MLRTRLLALVALQVAALPNQTPAFDTLADVPVGDTAPGGFKSHALAEDLTNITQGQLPESWNKQMEYSGKSFFDGFDFFTQPDPSKGLVNYVDRDAAISQGLAFWTGDGNPGIQMEHWSTTVPGTPRNSVRIHSKALYSGGIYIIDMRLMPWGCGVWPAFWTLGYEAEWPLAGEIDIIEGIQGMTNNQMTVHTTSGCQLNQDPGLHTGTIVNPVCDSSTGGSGCSIVSSSATSYGMPFNEAGGGVFAMLWDKTGIRMWNWNRAVIPGDIATEDPQPESWGTPAATFDASSCDPFQYFKPQQLILNINLCGEWAEYSYCPGTCEEYVANPLLIARQANLNNTVMLVNYIKVFQFGAKPPPSPQAENSQNQTGAGGPVPGANSEIATPSQSALPTPLTKPDNGSNRLSVGLGWLMCYLLLGVLLLEVL